MSLNGTKSRENNGPNSQPAPGIISSEFYKNSRVYKGIGQRLTGFFVCVSVVVRRFSTHDVFVYLHAVNILNFNRPRLIKLVKYGNHYYLGVRQGRCCVGVVI